MKIGYARINSKEQNLDLSVDIDVKNSTDNGGATNVSKKGMITFREDNNPSYPVDPEAPENPVIPQEPVNPNGAELMIIYASNLDFGKQSKHDLEWNALTDKIKDDSSSGQFRNVVPFVSVKDSRGSDRKGWKLEVKKDDEFKDEGGNILKGATLTYSNLHYSGQSNVPEATPGDIQINRDAAVIASANNTQGSGITSLALENIKKETTDQTSGVTLDVLPGTIINSKTYTSSITYELVAGV